MKKIITILAICLLFLAACGGQPELETKPAEKVVEKTKETIKLGAMFPLTGDASSYGEPLSRQLQLAIDEINEAGGIDGKEIEIILEDSKCSPKDGAAAAQKLVNVDQVKVIFGGACSGETLGAAPIVEENKVIIIAPSTTSPDITTAGDYVFRLAPSDAYAAKIAAEHAEAQGLTKAGIIYETTDYAQGLAGTFEKEFAAAGGEVVAKEAFSTEDTDVKTQILKIGREKPDVIYLAPQTPAKGVMVLKQIDEQGVNAQVYTGEVLIGKDVVAENAELAEGMIGVEAAFDEKGEIASKMLSAYEEEYGAAPWPFYQAAVRDSAFLIADAIKAKGLDSDGIKEYLYATKDWDGAIGKLTIDENGDPVLAFAVQKIQEGERVRLQ